MDIQDKARLGIPITRADYEASLTRKGSYPKDATLAYWPTIPPNAPIMPHFVPIPNDKTGSSYGTCGIRIDGTPAFVDAVLSRLQDLIAGENGSTRLELARRKVLPTEIRGERKTFENSVTDAEVCYIRLHERGQEAQMVNAWVGAVMKRHPEADCLANALDME